MEKSQIEHILRKHISDSDKILLIQEFLSLDESKNYGFNKLVSLTPREYKNLTDSYTSMIIDHEIHKLDAYLYKTGKKYASHYLTILNWLRRAGIVPIVKTTEWSCSFGALHKAGEECTCV